MTQIKAFVGHSFTPDDERVVSTFLKYFDQIKKMNFGFSWEHAEPAEPKALAEKVLRLIDDKNVFIGICTGKESAIASDKLRRGFGYRLLNTQVLLSEERNYVAKTSDWIIQEIGLAIGRKMDLILLLENGVRPPGGLQGNLEYIPFDRNAAERSFGKILEMIQALMPKIKLVQSGEAETTGAPPDVVEDENKKSFEKLQPKPEWQRPDYEHALLDSMLVGKDEDTKLINDTYLSTPEGQQLENQASWAAFNEYMRLLAGKGGRLAKLEQYAKENNKNSLVHTYLAKGYEFFKDHAKAARQYMNAAERTSEPEQALRRYTQAAVQFARADEKEEVRTSIQSAMRFLVDAEDGEVILTKTLLELADLSKDQDLFLGLSEKLVQLLPGDMDARFRLAYRYSEMDRNELALFHYLKIPYQERSDMTWNNLGVAFDQLELSSKSVKSYRIAESKNNTLSMSNLAQKLIRAGFLDEAGQLCDTAVKIADYHKNIGDAITRIRDIPNEEDTKEEELLAKVKPISDYYRDYGTAVTKTDISELEGVWSGPRCPLKVQIKNGHFTATGTYEQSPMLNALAVALGGNQLCHRINRRSIGLNMQEPSQALL